MIIIYIYYLCFIHDIYFYSKLLPPFVYLSLIFCYYVFLALKSFFHVYHITSHMQSDINMPFNLMNHFRVQSKQLRKNLYIWNYILFIILRRVRIFKWREKSLSTFHWSLCFLSLLFFFLLFSSSQQIHMSLSNRMYVRCLTQSQKEHLRVNILYFIHVRKRWKA